MPVDLITPAGNSITKADFRKIPVARNGGIFVTAAITILSLPTNNTSMGKRIKNVCTEFDGRRIIAWFASSEL